MADDGTAGEILVEEIGANWLYTVLEHPKGMASVPANAAQWPQIYMMLYWPFHSIPGQQIRESVAEFQDFMRDELGIVEPLKAPPGFAESMRFEGRDAALLRFGYVPESMKARGSLWPWALGAVALLGAVPVAGVALGLAIAWAQGRGE